MKKSFFFLFFPLCLNFISFEMSAQTTIAIIDSGVDYQHPDFSMWKNPVDLEGNDLDEDQNGYLNDVYGWNFAEGNNQIIDYKYLGTFSPIPYRFFEIQGKFLKGEATDSELKWMEGVSKNPLAMMELMKFGNFVHGTHVAGIAGRGHQSHILGVKLIPTEIKPFIEMARSQAQGLVEGVDFRAEILRQLLTKLASAQGQVMSQIGDYLASHAPQVANGSFGTGPVQAKAIVTPLFQALYRRAPDERELQEHAQYFLQAFLKASESLVVKNPETLFVFAAGNDHNDNDLLPTSPASLDRENVLTVAAASGNLKLAVFSSYGKKSVDVVAPGVGIHSAIPGGMHLFLSGTSQASPFVAQLAGEILNINPELTVAEVKRIIMGTVDVREELREKVVSSGMVNSPRAYYVAQASKHSPLSTAIALGLKNVENLPQSAPLSNLGLWGDEQQNGAWVVPMPSPFF